VQPLPLPKSTKQVRLQMNLDGENYPNYQVKLRTAGGRDILTQTALRPTPNKKSVVVNIPASRLSQGDYVLTFSGVTSDNEIEEINQYFFRVIPK
jgi:methionine-rich copper-binding protein CopC